MSSTQHSSRGGSTDSQDSAGGHEYNDSDRQQMTAETDAAIANVRARSPSTFATGHLPNDKDDEATDQSWQGASNSSVEKTEPKKNMGNKALIVNHSWGGSIQGGVTDSVHLLIRLLRQMGLSVYCTALTATEAEIKEAKAFGVELIVPSPIRKFKARNDTPDSDWLYRHKEYFSDLKELANVRLVFGIGMVTSEAAFEIERDLFPRAAFYLINLFDSNRVTPIIANCCETDLDLRLEDLTKEGQDSNSVFSVGGSVFLKYEKVYRSATKKIKHLKLSPMVDKNNFKLPSPEALKANENFHILSVFQEHELGNLKSDSVIVQAMNSVADLVYKNGQSPPTWKILGVPKRCESELRNRLNLHSKLDVVLARMPSDKGLKDELCQCNLVLVPPSSTHYVNLTLAAMCAAVPVIIPWGSLSHDLIKQCMGHYESWLVVDMDKSDALREGIMRFLCQYNVALNKAREIKEELWNKVGQELENINETFLKVVKEDAEVIHSVTLPRQQSPEEKQEGREDDKEKHASQNESNISPGKRKWQGRDPGDMKVKMTVSEVVPEKGRTVQEVEKDFYGSDEVKMKTEEVGQSLDGQHDAMNLKGIGDGSISYTMSCQSLDALECLVGQYENGKLQDLMEDEFLSDELLDKIGAYYLAIDVTIDYVEYLMCRKEFIQIYGLPSQTNEGEQDTDKMESPEIDVDNTPIRVNRARDLLKEFQMEGDKVTETQINTLDKFLQEKAQRRQLDHQQRLQESAKDPTSRSEQQLFLHDSESKLVVDVNLLTDKEIEKKNEELESKINELTMRSGLRKSRNRNRGQDRDSLKSMVVDGEKASEHEVTPHFSQFVEIKSETRDHVTKYPEMDMETKKLSVYADHIVRDAEIPEETKKVYMDVRQLVKGCPVKGSVLEVFGEGSMPANFDTAWGIFIKNSGQWVICDRFNHRVQVIDPIKLCCDLILQFHAFPKTFYPYDVTVDEDNDKYFMTDWENGQVVASSGQSKILNCFGCKEGIRPTGICLSPDGFIFIGDMKGYVRKYKQYGELIASTERGQVTWPYGLIVNKKYVFVSDNGRDRKCVHVLNHQMQSIRDIGKGHLEGPEGLCFDHQQDGIYVCDYLGHRVVHFNCDGEFLSYIGQGQLEKPLHIALCKDSPQRLLVTQSDCIKLLYI